MPKHGWKWRTEQVRKLGINDLDELLHWSSQRRVSSRLARWIYEHCIPDPDLTGLRVLALDRIGSNDDAGWRRAFLWRELETHKAEPFGYWCVVALSRSCHGDLYTAHRFMELYKDESAHPDTRGSAIYGINSSIPFSDGSAGRFPAETWDAIRTT